MNYWKLYCAIHGIKICRKCGDRLPDDYDKKRGNLCKDCSPYKKAPD